ncbi:Macrolide export ATP-binding/permease protein MacB [Planctomycetes bacterium Pan216]|uniref:Macrolide export ATP-binding/permease protein MacB n=1 Tax=Kolteria novifilia TaxID=2527975 RepID=A0A518B3E6_9BACT|nr:Macrolide export ATP-binding/permease protein MacB [Planctomycetes bacterium Pan216]
MNLSLRALWLTVRVGVKSLFLHKLRSALTVLGILIGVTAVIWLVAMGEGISERAQEQIKSLGATSIIVRSVKPTDVSSGGGPGSLMVRYGILRDDFTRLTTGIPAIVEAVPMREITKAVRHGQRLQDCRLVGAKPAFQSINQLRVGRGRFLTEQDVRSRSNVAVIAAGVAEQLFPFENPIGESIQVGDDFYTIVGQTESRTPSAGIGGSLSAQNFNADVYIPLSTLRVRIGDQVLTARSGSFEGEIVELSQITLKVGSLDEVDGTAEMVEELLRRYHDTPDYAVVVPKELLRQAEIMRMLLSLLSVVIAGISLLVGGIGIMNIMLATVTERTREIGIRRALGAKRSHIMWQFLTETLVLTATGGLLGVLLGLSCGTGVWLLQNFMQAFYPDVYQVLPDAVRDLVPRVAPWSVFVSLGIAMMVGLFFGLYPARRAALMDPIEALRHE